MGSKGIEQLRKADIFSGLPDAELAKVGKVLRERKFVEDQVIFHQGDPGTHLFIVTQGRVRISTTDQMGREKVLAFCGEGEFFGDMAVLTGGVRSATAQASTPVRALELRKEDFDALAARNVGVMKEMLQVMAQRQAAMNERLSQEAGVDAGEAKGLTTVVFSPCGGAGKSTVAANLAAALALASPDRV